MSFKLTYLLSTMKLSLTSQKVLLMRLLSRWSLVLSAKSWAKRSVFHHTVCELLSLWWEKRRLSTLSSCGDNILSIQWSQHWCPSCGKIAQKFMVSLVSQPQSKTVISRLSAQEFKNLCRMNPRYERRQLLLIYSNFKLTSKLFLIQTIM